jgi:hypothetical protein
MRETAHSFRKSTAQRPLPLPQKNSLHLFFFSDEGTSKVWKPPGRSFTVARDATVKTQDKLVVGLHLFPHDATMAIVNDGRVIAVLELERLLEKRYYGITMHVDRYASIAMCVRPV